LRQITQSLINEMLVMSDGSKESELCDVNFVAHHDDDILFMQPDILSSYSQGSSQVTVFLTGGNDGVWNDVDNTKGREEGAKSAYAQMELIRMGSRGASTENFKWQTKQCSYGGVSVTCAES